ncbi:hypothetical protein PZ739_17660 [Pseudomonas kermanshahensis]|uniref:hypothetical protein n=1 Tax=Pseudomonas kermanshahensis TaxID=2745482 RepID=UPI0023DA3229|nr:hypothetical protein [Pseudomonas kermanshahensis]WEL53659.1 hypothetical protein PZ739_17660 [Pseudomonas kermanshahensis]
MRFPSLLALSVAGALLLPVAANAGSFPAGAKQTYMTQCVDAATAKGLDKKSAEQHCTCGSKAIEKNFSDEEIKDLDSKDGVDAKLMQKAQTVVQQACMKG